MFWFCYPVIKELNMVKGQRYGILEGCSFYNFIMRPKGGKKSFKLPDVKDNKSLSYALHSINIAAKGCYDQTKRLRLDIGFGDYNMRLFRLRDKKNYVRTIPSAFTPLTRSLLHCKPEDSGERRIATEHNEQIERILNQPKEIYLQMIRKEREEQQRRRQEEAKRNEFIKGEDRELREYNEQLSFNYLPGHQANQWFKVVDRSPTYVPPTPISFNTSLSSFSPSPLKTRKKRGHIFLSDDKSLSKTKRNG